MPNYKWKCSACDKTNDEGTDNCAYCKCPSEISAEELEEWKKYGRFRPQDPTISGLPQYGRSRPRFLPVAPCSSCTLLMYVRDDECPRCGHIQSPIEKKAQIKYSRGRGDFDYRHFFLFWLALIIFIFCLLYFNYI